MAEAFLSNSKIFKTFVGEANILAVTFTTNETHQTFNIFDDPKVWNPINKITSTKIIFALCSTPSRWYIYFQSKFRIEYVDLPGLQLYNCSFYCEPKCTVDSDDGMHEL